MTNLTIWDCNWAGPVSNEPERDLIPSSSLSLRFTPLTSFLGFRIWVTKKFSFFRFFVTFYNFFISGFCSLYSISSVWRIKARIFKMTTDFDDAFVSSKQLLLLASICSGALMCKIVSLFDDGFLVLYDVARFLILCFGFVL